MLSQVDCHLWVETEILRAILVKILTLIILEEMGQQQQQRAVVTQWRSRDEPSSTTANANKNLLDAPTSKANDW